jgi:hypothetical protein
MILRDHHPLKGKLLQVLGWTHRGGILHLTLVLPDGTRSLIPAAWTDLDLDTANNSSVIANASSSPRLGSVSDLLRTRTIVDALLRRLDGTVPADTSATTEESRRETTTGFLARGARAPGANTNLGECDSRRANQGDQHSGKADSQGSLSTKDQQD